MAKPDKIAKPVASTTAKPVPAKPTAKPVPAKPTAKPVPATNVPATNVSGTVDSGVDENPLKFLVNFGSDDDAAVFDRRLAGLARKGLVITGVETNRRQRWDAARDQRWAHLWRGMPEFVNVPGHAPWKSLRYSVRDEQSSRLFQQALGQPLWKTHSDYIRGYWFPARAPRDLSAKAWVTKVPCPPRYPVYIISKGRWERPLTARTLEAAGVRYRIVVEPQERDLYAKVVDPRKILVLPFQNLGQGSIPARNWVWEHSIKEGHRRHWILDDNITALYRRNRNEKRKCVSGNILRAAEDWVDRYSNVGLAGFNYQQFVVDQVQHPPVVLNTRIYSCILVNNSMKHRWRGKYNEDTDLSLRMLKDGACTALFNAFLIFKTKTMTMKGGNTDEVYKGGKNRREFAESLKRQHPDVVTITQRYRRWHHMVNYSSFRDNALKPVAGRRVPGGVNAYGMALEIVNKAVK